MVLHDLSPLLDTERICGDLRISGPVSNLDALARLQVVEGSLIFEDTDIESISLPRLMQVEGHLGVTSNESLTSLQLPALEVVGGELAITQNSNLATLEWTRLHSVKSSVLVSKNTVLTELNLNALAEVESIEITNNAGLAHILIPPKIETLDTLIITENLTLAMIEGGTGISLIGDLSIVNNNALTTVDLSIPGQIETMTISENAQLQHITGIEKSAKVDWLSVVGNPQLAQLAGPGSGAEVFVWYVAGNTSLTSLEPLAVDRISFATVILNSSLPPAQVMNALAEVEVDELKVDGNEGQPIPHTQTCPWTEDFECDQEESLSGQPGTGLCTMDELDCAY